MNGRKLATPGAVMIFAGAFLLYWGLREFGIVGASGGTGNTTATTTSVQRST